MFEPNPLEADKASFSDTEITEKFLALKKRSQEQKEQIPSLKCVLLLLK